MAGYDNISYFYGIFKNKYGHTPKKYREQFAD
ncbi:AraC family transcriptional regulator [Peribacillus sp. B-H-3]